MMRVLLDTNVLLDAFLQRQPWHVEADAILVAAGRREVACAITPLTIANLYYIGRRVIGAMRARADVRRCLTAFEVLPIDRIAVVYAESLPIGDFEDAIQLAAAVFASLDGIVTRDVTGFSQSPLPVWTATELLRVLSSARPQL